MNEQHSDSAQHSENAQDNMQDNENAQHNARHNENEQHSEQDTAATQAFTPPTGQAEQVPGAFAPPTAQAEQTSAAFSSPASTPGPNTGATAGPAASAASAASLDQPARQPRQLQVRNGLLVWAIVIACISVLTVLAAFGFYLDLWICTLVVLSLAGLLLLGLSISSYLSTRQS